MSQYGNKSVVSCFVVTFIAKISKLNSVALLARRVLNKDIWVKLEIVYTTDCSRTVTTNSSQAITSVNNSIVVLQVVLPPHNSSVMVLA